MMMVFKLAITNQKIFDGSLKMLAQCSAMIIKANIMLEVIRNWIENKPENIFAPLYKITAYPHLENCPIHLTTVQWSSKVMRRVIRNTEQLPCGDSMQLFILEKKI